MLLEDIYLHADGGCIQNGCAWYCRCALALVAWAYASRQALGYAAETSAACKSPTQQQLECPRLAIYLSRSLWTMEAVITMHAVPQGLHARAAGQCTTAEVGDMRRHRFRPRDGVCQRHVYVLSEGCGVCGCSNTWLAAVYQGHRILERT